MAFAPRSPPEIVLGTKVEPWLTETLKRSTERPLKSVFQHRRYLSDVLGGSDAIWTLTSLLLPKVPNNVLRKHSDPLIEAPYNYEFIHIEAYVTHVDMVSQHEVAFKLTPGTIEQLIQYHGDIGSIDVSAETTDWAEKETQVKEMQAKFKQDANKFIFRTSPRALEGMEGTGAGDLLEGRSGEVKCAIMQLFSPLVAPEPSRPSRGLATLLPKIASSCQPGASQSGDSLYFRAAEMDFGNSGLSLRSELFEQAPLPNSFNDAGQWPTTHLTSTPPSYHCIEMTVPPSLRQWSDWLDGAWITV